MSRDLLETYRCLEQRINERLIRPESYIRRMAEENPLHRARRKFEEAGAFLERIGNPQKSYPTVFITGTSGKGSVASMVARALGRMGFKVGLHTSPYVQVLTEKVWIDGKYADVFELEGLLDRIWPLLLELRKPEAAVSAHGMAGVSLAYLAFEKEQVDVAVVEAGVGGRFDLNNHLEPVCTCITNVGMDHLVTLGPAIEDIAWHKAGIARKAVPLVTAARGAALAVVGREAEKKGAKLVKVKAGAGDPFFLVNRRLALAVLKNLPEPFRSDDESVLDGIDTSRLLPARVEVLPGGRVILDGAHNPDKLGALARALAARGVREKPVMVYGQLESKDIDAMLEKVCHMASAIVATEPHVHEKPAVPAREIAGRVSKIGLMSLKEPDPAEAVRKAMAMADKRPVLVTGSMYMVGAVRNLVYPVERVLRERTSWPEPLISLS